MVVERFNFFGDREVFVGDGPVGDTRVHESHGEGLVTEERCDRFE